MNHLGDLVFHQNTAQDVMHEWACCHDEASNHQLYIAAAFWISQIVSAEECSSLTQNLMQIHCSTCSVILNVMATQYICSLNSVYSPHWLVYWSHHCSCMHIPVHSLYWCHTNHSCYINSSWTFSKHTLCIYFQWLWNPSVCHFKSFGPHLLF